MLVCLFVCVSVCLLPFLLSVCLFVCMCVCYRFSQKLENISPWNFDTRLVLVPKVYWNFFFSFVNPMFVCLFVCLSLCLLPFFSETSKHISMKFWHKVGNGLKGVLKCFFFFFFSKSDVCVCVCLSVRVFVTVFIICLFVCRYVCLLPFFSETREDISMKFGHNVGIRPIF